MIAEQGTDAQLKHSLLFGWGATIRTTLERMNDKWLTVESWVEVDGLVMMDCTSTLDRFRTMLHIGTYVLRHGLAFDLVARCDCRRFNGPQGFGASNEREHCEFSFDKAAARTGPSGESLSAVSAQAARVRQVGVSNNRADGRDRRYQRVGRGPAHESARRAGVLHGFCI